MKLKKCFYDSEEDPRLFRLFVACIILLFISTPLKASADTGSLLIDEYNGISYSYADMGAGPDVNPLTSMKFDTTDFSKLSKVDLTLSPASTITLDSNSTTFTITAGGTGSGVVSYTKSDKRIVWYFTSDTVITSSPFTLSYAQNIFNTVTAKVAFGDIVPNSTHPLTVIGWSAASLSGSYITQTRTTATADYNVTYSFLGNTNLFTALVNKTSTVATKVNITMYNGTCYACQTSFSTTNASITTEQVGGIVITMATATGGSDSVTVNTTGATIPTATPTVTADPTTGAGVMWDATNYNVGDIGNVSWTVDSGTFDFLSDFNIKITTSDGTVVKEIHDLPSSGSYNYLFADSGVFTATFYKSVCVLGVCSNTEKGSDSATVSKGLPYIYAPAEIGAGVAFTIQYQYGKTTSSGFIEDQILDEFGIPILTASKYTNASCPCTINTAYNLSYSTNGLGTHKLILWDASEFKIVDSTLVRVNQGNPAGFNLTSDSLTLDNTQYNVNDIIHGSYQISNTNWTAYSYFFISLNSAANVPIARTVSNLGSQAGVFDLPLTPNSMLSIYQSGAAFVNLTAQSSVLGGNTVTLANVSVTLLNNYNGYSIYVSPQQVCKDDPIYVKYTAPTGAGLLKITTLEKGGTKNTDSYQFSSNGTIKYTVNTQTTLDQSAVRFEIWDTAGTNIMVSDVIKYRWSLCTPSGSTETTATATPQSAQTATTNFLGSGMFIAFIMIGIFSSAGYAIGGLMGAALGFGGGFIFAAIFGYVPKWALFLFAIFTIIIFAIKAKDSITGPGSDR